MRITFKGDYALKAVLDLAIHYGSPVSIEEISKRQDIPYKFLEQILLQLKKGGFVKSQRGRYGGYLLSRIPAKIQLANVIEYIEGPLEPITCVAKYSQTHCDYSKRCALHDIFNSIGKVIRDEVEKYTFEDIKNMQLKKQMAKKAYMDYSI
ncbi:RrF2 family transcriptional regulator [Candidatus Margulisiibacteriota bacterium]